MKRTQSKFTLKGFLLLIVLCNAMVFEGYAQPSMALSGRFNVHKTELATEFPPRIFLTFIANDSLRFGFGFEVFMNQDRYKRDWPDIGPYSVIYRESGAGLLFKYRFVKINNFSCHGVVGVGFWGGNYTLKHSSPMLDSYIMKPKSKNGLYGFVALNWQYKLTKSSTVWIHTGRGFNEVAVGYTHTFTQI